MGKSAAEEAREAKKREAARRAALAKRMPTGTTKGDVLPSIPDTKEEKSGGGGQSGLGALSELLGGVGGGKKANGKKTVKPSTKKKNGKTPKAKTETKGKKAPATVDPDKKNGKTPEAKTETKGKKAPARVDPDKKNGKTPEAKDETKDDYISVEQEDVWEDPGGDNWVQDDWYYDDTPTYQETDTGWGSSYGYDDSDYYDSEPYDSGWDTYDSGWADTGGGSSWYGWKHGGRIKKAKKAKKAKAESPKHRRRPALRGRRRELKGS